VTADDSLLSITPAVLDESVAGTTLLSNGKAVRPTTEDANV